MKFDVPEVRECLMKNLEVYTVRAFESASKLSIVTVNGISDCTKEKLFQVKSYKDLTRYTHLSGFKSPMEWWRKIEAFKATEGWMYHVKALPEEGFYKDVCLANNCKKISTCKLRETAAFDLCPMNPSSKHEGEAFDSPLISTKHIDLEAGVAT